MTTHLENSLSTLGFPIAKLKALLTSWERTGKSPQEMLSLAGVSLSAGSTTALFLGSVWMSTEESLCSSFVSRL